MVVCVCYVWRWAVGRIVGDTIVGDAMNHGRRDESRLYKGGW